ncbi:hypothetical protein Pmani_020091 [Petrolisthes manimaculis]|uniref:AAA+ ATPase domain-containing protein n=1 Tax=Petrolisthes manimaculis TaxID=1843537 RepID=A0AAE1PH14_9EUCA|nr:hypothetical protein Pmani_020091 [Petrolisthes manimaculis]
MAEESKDFSAAHVNFQSKQRRTDDEGMSELGYATLPRGRRLPPTPNGALPHHHHLTSNNKNTNNNNNNCNGHLPNANHHLLNNIINNNNNNQHHQHHNNINNLINSHALFHGPNTGTVSNGGVGGSKAVGNGFSGMRAIHDGFATIRSGGNKRGRSRSSPSVTVPSTATTTSSPCHHPCCHPGTSPTWTMEPLWEERGGGQSHKATVARRDRSQLPWWEVATRRSRYRSCPTFSQASMVSALEQTMTNVTDRLERLASSPDLKETEAAELRKTAAVLRQQSSAVCQSVSSVCHPMERQLSCDSVSSVTSTVSGASMSSYASLGSHSLSAALTPHCSHLNHTHAKQNDATNATSQAKLKKRSWLRSSFRRAFGRHGRKRKQGSENGATEENPQELPLHHTVNTAVRHLPVPPSRSSQQQSAPANKKQGQPKLQRQQNVFEESEVLSRLHQELNEKDHALTETRLEVLSAQHQLQAQTDTIVKLQAELVGLREENKRLVTMMRGEHGASTEPLLSTLTHTFSTLTLKRPSGKGIGGLSQREDGRQVKVVLVNQPGLTSISRATGITLDPQHLTHIGNITVESKTTWDALDTKIVNTLKDYGNRVDPVSALGLDSGGCLLCYRVEGVVCGPSLPRPELLPCGYCVGSVDSLHVWLKGVIQKRDGENIGCLSAACFSSLIPAPSLTPLISLLVSHPRLVLAGPPASGKTHLAHTLAKLLVENSGRKSSEDTIKVFKVTGTNSLELCQFLSSIWPRGLSTSTRSTTSLSTVSSNPSSLSTTPPILSSTSSTSTLSANSPTGSVHSSAASTLSASSITSSITNIETSSTSPPAVIILDDLHAAGGVVETLQRCLPTTVHTGPAIIATCCPTATLSTRLQIHCNFRWTTLSTQQEPVRGLLGRVLRRKVAAAEVAANTRLPDAHHLAEWLTRLWMHLNTLLSGHCGSNDVGVGPGLLTDCPLGQEETQVWFTEVWNTRLVPHIISTVRSSATANSTLLETWTDPLDWVLATYPWPNNASCGPDQLTRIPATDIRQKEGTLPVTRPTASHRPYTSYSLRQQNQTSESVYAVPQILPRPPAVIFTATHGTSQPVVTLRQSDNSHATGQISVADTIELENNTVKDNMWCNSSHEHNDNLATIRRARSKSCTTTTPQTLTVAGNGQNISVDQMVLTSDTGNKFTTRRLRVNTATKSQENISNRGLAVLTPVTTSGVILRNFIVNNKITTEDEDYLMDTDCLTDNTSDNTDESDLHSIISSDSRNHNHNMGSKTDLTMESDCTGKRTGPQSLDILAENVLNNNGLGPDCVKIIRGAVPKVDLRGLAQELTTTFKPVESAM